MTNILASVSQIDLALVTLLVGLVSDYELSCTFLRAREEAFAALRACPPGEKETGAKGECPVRYDVRSLFL